jgi:hypothetical protein
MPCYAFGLLFYANPYINLMVPESSKQISFVILALFSIVLPIITALILKQFKMIDSLYMKSAQERRWPFMFTLIWYYMALQLLSKMHLPESFDLLMIGAISAIGLALIITLRWKISIHMLGIGGLVGAILGVSQRFQYNHSLLIIVLIIWAGVIGYARLKTISHNYRQVYVGFLLGALIEWFSVMYF